MAEQTSTSPYKTAVNTAASSGLGDSISSTRRSSSVNKENLRARLQKLGSSSKLLFQPLEEAERTVVLKALLEQEDPTDYEDGEDDDDLTVNSYKSVGSNKSRRSDHSDNSSRSSARSSLLFKDRTERNIAKADYTYRYKCKGGKLGTDEWSATFDGTIEEFIYPSLQHYTVKLKPKSRGDISNSQSRGDMTPTSPEGSPNMNRRLGTQIETEFIPNTNIMSARWKLVTKEDADDKGREENNAGPIIEDDLKRGEKFLRDSIQRNYRLRIKRDAELEKKKFAASKKKEKDKLEALENNVGLLVGKSDAFFLPKAADEVYKALVMNSRTKSTTAVIFKRAMQKIKGMSNVEKLHATCLPTLVSKAGEENRHLVDGLLYYQMKNRLTNISRHSDDDKHLKVQMKEKTPHHLLIHVDPSIESKEVSPFSPNNNKDHRPLNRSRTNSVAAIAINDGDLSPFGGGSSIELQQDDSLLHEVSRVIRATDTINIGIELDADVNNSSILRYSPPKSPSRNFTFSTLDDEDSKLDTTSNILPSEKRTNKDFAAPSRKELTVEEKKMHAKDVLLINQLKSGIIPEQLLKKVPNSIHLMTLNLAHYGLGDELGKCLGGCLPSLSMLEALGLCDNRLTGKSLSVIVDNLNLESLNHLDISDNDARGIGCDAISRMLTKRNVLRILELSQCKIKLRDFSKLCESLLNVFCVLQELCISKNMLNSTSALELSKVLLKYKSPLTWIDASWNCFEATGALHIAEALKENRSLRYLDLSSNAIRDDGGQAIAASLQFNRSLEKLILRLNNIKYKACFVFSRTLCKHKSMINLDISSNPLGEPGARAMFRMILKGMTCFVAMRDCSFPEDPTAFNHSNPALKSPYFLDLSEPYQGAVFHELMEMYKENPNCKIDSVTHRQTAGGKESTFYLGVKAGEIVTKKDGYYWEPPAAGIVKVSFSNKVSIPTLLDAISGDAYKVMSTMLIHAKSDIDRKNWLQLICVDVLFTTTQARNLLDLFISNNFLEPGGITKVFLFECLWDNIIDTENKHNFLCQLDEKERLALGHSISFEKLRFNWVNPAGHWRLDVGNRSQRDVIMKFIAINTIESHHSHKESGRGDTSQKGNWNNFRNEIFNHSEPVVIDEDYMYTAPVTGVLEFDYVSTTRPAPDAIIITSTELDVFFARLGLNPRRRLHKSLANFKLIELQLASTQYYFSTSQVLNIMDCFSQEEHIQAKVVVTMHCRIKDLENFQILIRNLSGHAVQLVFEALGILNVINPLTPANDYKLSLKYMDNRLFVHALCSLASNESGDQIRESPKTEVLIIDLFAAMGRIINEVQDKNAIFSYCEIGERSCQPAWQLRKDMVHKFLIGTQPIDIAAIHRPFAIYKELEAAGVLSVGALDLQYRQYLKNSEASKNKQVKLK